MPSGTVGIELIHLGERIVCVRTVRTGRSGTVSGTVGIELVHLANASLASRGSTSGLGMSLTCLSELLLRFVDVPLEGIGERAIAGGAGVVVHVAGE